MFSKSVITSLLFVLTVSQIIGIILASKITQIILAVEKSLSFSWDMNKQKKIFFWISWIALLLISSLMYYTFAFSDQWIISIEITGIGIRHGTPDNVNLWVLNTSSSDQEFSGQFTDYFRVEDMEGYVTGHYTTIQCDGVHGPVTLTWVYLKAGNTSPELIQGLTGNHVLINSELSSYTNILAPITYIYKETNSSNAGLINRYGDKPWLKILIPGGTPPGTYSGTIVFSFYME